MKEKKVRLAYNTAPVRAKRLRQMALDLDISVQEVIDRAADILLNPPGESTVIVEAKYEEKIKTGLQSRNLLVHTMADTRSANPDDEFLGLDIETLASLPVWEEWIRMIMLSINETALNGTSSALSTYLLHLKTLAQIKSLESGIAHDPNAPDYAAAARRCEQAVQQLRLLFAGSRKDSSL